MKSISKEKDDVLMNDLKAVLEFLSDFDLLKVYQKENDKTIVFDSCGISVFRNNIRDIGFCRTFSDTIVLDALVTDIRQESNIVHIHCGDLVYMIHPVHQKITDKKSVMPEKIYLDTFLDESYLDLDHINYDNNSITVYIDINKLGYLSKKETNRIRRIIEQSLDGAKVCNQCCRVPAFTVSFSDSDYNICGHIYDYPNKRILNKVEIYNTIMDFGKVFPYHKFVSFIRALRC